MRPITIALALFALPLSASSLTVSDANAPFTLSPNVAPTSGDTVVRITGRNLANCATGPSPLVCDQATVQFDGVSAPVVAIGPDEITVKAPDHRAGTVDVAVQTSSGVRTATAAFNYFDIRLPFDPTFFEPVFFPVLISGPGASGAKWSTDVAMRNENDYPFPVPGLFSVLCFPVCDTRPPAHSTVLVTSANEPAGYVLEVPRQAAPKLFFEAIVRDLSRQAEAFGTEIPVLREDDFLDRPFTLLDIPTDSRYRVALRVYRNDGGGTVQVSISPINSKAEPPVDTTIHLTPSVPGSQFAIGYVGDLVHSYPALAGQGALRIDIDGGPGQRGTWAFVSITNNDTNHVSVVSPQ